MSSSALATDMRRSAALVWGVNPALCVALVALAAASGVLPTLIVWVGKLIVDAVTGHDGHALMVALGAELGLTLAASAVGSANDLAQNLLRSELGHEVNRRILDKVLTLDITQFEDAAFYDRLVRARREASVRPLSMVRRLLSFLQLGTLLAGSTALVVRFSPLAAGVLVVAALPTFLIQRRYADETFRLFNWRAPEVREQGYYEALLSGEPYVKEIKLFGLGPLLLGRYRAIHDQLYAEDRRLAIRRTGALYLANNVGPLAYYAVYAWIAWEAVEGRLTLGDMTLYLAAFQQAQSTLAGFLGAANGIAEDRLYLSNLFGFLDTEVPGEPGAATAGPTPGDGVRFEGVAFSYPGASKPALSGIDLHLAPGQKLALVGHNGSGKTTLIKLLTRLYTPTEGRVLLDGLDLREWDAAALRRRVGVVLQDFVKYQLAAGENIGLGDLDRLDDVDAQARAARRGLADEVIASLPKGLATRLGKWFKDGVELSGGQWQRVALARAFMRDGADVIVLDEPTAAMDAEAEAALFAHIREAAADRMAVLISHRFSTVRLADRIVVLDDGRITEQGTHAELMTLGGRYARLFSLQAEGYR
ncbi:MAG TPA: ABC transporter ATP-binding protein [Myxococcota bacterium]|nr:ABC transporter ATP-binding protein [Myxococcota bacterium]